MSRIAGLVQMIVCMGAAVAFPALVDDTVKAADKAYPANTSGESRSTEPTAENTVPDVHASNLRSDFAIGNSPEDPANVLQDTEQRRKRRQSLLSLSILGPCKRACGFEPGSSFTKRRMSEWPSIRTMRFSSCLTASQARTTNGVVSDVGHRSDLGVDKPRDPDAGTDVRASGRPLGLWNDRTI